jgi:ribosomal protein S18 acetylase RimI-like enzyme
MFIIENFSQKHFHKINNFFLKEIKKIKPDSLLFSFSKKLFLKYFKYLLKKDGLILLIKKDKKVYGCLIFEKCTGDTINFLNDNSISILKNLFFSRYLIDKIILINIIFNRVFFNKKISLYKNNIIIIAVKNEVIGQGIGTKLILFLKKKVKSKIHVMTDVNNIQAQKFYIKNNFKIKKNIRYGLRKLKVYCYK